MHVHVPKPLHGWRALTGEVGIIVLGVLIALGAEQVVETLHWAQRKFEAEAAMSTELGEDNGAQANARIALSHCYAEQLDQVERALVAERDGGVAFVAPPIAAPAFRTWDDNAWRAAVSSDATAHMTTATMLAWSMPYVFIPAMNDAALRESSDWADLYRIRQLRPHPSEAEREAIFAALSRARHDNDLLTTVSRYFLTWTTRAHVQVPDTRKREELKDQRREMGNC